ncbi:MAG: carbamoyltransferase HypF [Deltaproteobacteria bacterium]|nr:carbamoyltransferase HypF [Deltaproteobacteria bacterium]
MRIRKRFTFEGMVQGVGFRPFLWRQAQARNLAGFVRNRPDGVVAEVEGETADIAAFLAGVKGNLPPLADITRISETTIALVGDEGFAIVPSDSQGPAEVLISPDIATCDACRTELCDPTDRRFRYPFINCTDCGPRLTIIRTIPYDRVNTSMACFPMCPQCQKEYADPAHRRFHAEPNACPLCGPRLELLDETGQPLPAEDPIGRALELLKEGAILAIKGLGGFHLAVHAQNEAAVRRLRTRKCREEKPLAVMVRDLAAAARLAEIGETERALLASPERPIVLLARRADAPLAPAVAPGMATLGIMLPYTPLQHLLLAGDLPTLVMTSGNRTDEPICIGNREALCRLKGIADAFVVHNRDILVRCDDSVVMAVAGTLSALRRSRGYAPRPIVLRTSYPEVLALGPQLKATLCVLKGRSAFLSPHVGDLETPEARDFLHESVALMERITQCRPGLVACDLHPGYYTSQTAREMEGREVVAIQHHHAHIVSCMAENRLEGEVIGLAMDGTGYGTDGQAWGGEFLVADERTFTRRGHLRYHLLPGGERAIQEPWRMAASLLRAAYGADWQEMAQRLSLTPAENHDGDGRSQAAAALAGLERAMAGQIHSPWTSSLGRIFDGVAALAGLRRRVGFEGQAAMELEALAQIDSGLRLPFALREERPDDPFSGASGEKVWILDFSPAVRTMTEALLKGQPAGSIAGAFHRLLPEACTATAVRLREETGINRAVLGGGCFQNRLFLAGCLTALRKAGFETFHHRLVPNNDGGISLGQAVCAGARAKKK